MYKYLLTCFIFLLSCQLSSGQEVVFSAQAGASKIGIEDQVQVQYTLQNVTNIQSINPPAEITEQFHVVGGPYSSQSSQTSFVNGEVKQSTSITIAYILQPKRKGSLTIPSATAKDAEGHTYKSNPLDIQVVNGSVVQQQQRRQQQYDPWGGQDPFEELARRRQQQLEALRRRQQQMMQRQQGNAGQQQPQSAENLNLDNDLFIKVIVDKSNVYVGEQITATYKLYARVPMNVSISKLPSLNGFWTQDFEIAKGGAIRPVEETYKGQRYQVFTLKKSALFPQHEGDLELDPAEAEGMARIIQRSSRDPFAQNGFGSLFMDDPFFNDEFFGGMTYRDVKVKLKSDPVKIKVKPLPVEGKPDHYGGAVGNFTVDATLDKTDFTTDDVANLKLKIAGSGNLKLIEAPVLNLPNGLVSYDPQITDTITGRSTEIKGEKLVNYAITPRTPGTYEIPAIPFTYFNTKTNEYVTLHTKPMNLTVKPGKTYKPPTLADTKLTDIHDIDKKPIEKLSAKSKPLVFTVGYWSAYAVPMLAFLGLIFYKRREEELSKDSISLRSKRANKIALKRLSTAQKLLQENKTTPFYEEVSKAIWLYLSDKISIPLSELSKEKAWAVLEERNIDKDLQEQTARVMNECETALYANVSGEQQMNRTFTDAVDVISKLEQHFKA